MKWIPNALTIARCVFAVLVLYGVWKAQAAEAVIGAPTAQLNSMDAAMLARLWYQFAFLAFISGALTDFLDGWVARALDAHSRFGVWLDPIADKLLVGAALAGLALILKSPLVYIPAAAIIARDIFMTWFRTTPQGADAVSPSNFAKWKTAVEMVAIIGLMLPFAIVGPRVPGQAGIADSAVANLTGYGLVALLWVAAFLSLYTGWQYVAASKAGKSDNIID